VYVKDLHGAVAVVTGGGSGIGAATARSLAARGTAIAVLDVNAKRAEQTCDEIRDAGGHAIAVGCDVRSDQAWAEARDVVQSELGRADILMNNAGGIIAGDPLEIPLQDYHDAFDLNVLSALRGVRTFAPAMIETGSGHVVNTASTAGLYPYSWDRTPYSSTKAALISLTYALHLYLVPKGVGVTCFCPGAVATRIAEGTTFVGGRRALQGAGLSRVPAEDVGELVVEEGVVKGAAFLTTHPEAVDSFQALATDPGGFLAATLERIGSHTIERPGES
jgi:NAD(P)-dependent dehydrogenase (short-subunit alcohol dehydrogenase family)